MQSLNVKEWKLFELQITQTWHPLHISDGKMSKFNTHKKCENIYQMHKIEGAHPKCVDNHYAKFEYKGIKTGGVTDYTN